MLITSITSKNSAGNDQTEQKRQLIQLRDEKTRPQRLRGLYVQSGQWLCAIFSDDKSDHQTYFTSMCKFTG